MSLRTSYRFLAPAYDAIAGGAFARARALSLAHLPRGDARAFLLDGIGTGLDLPLLPREHRYTGLDATRAMLDRAARRTDGPPALALVEGDAMQLPFPDACFDGVIAHLIVAVVPRPVDALREAARVTRPGGLVLVLDKFLRRGARAPLRRLLSPLAGRIATRLDVVFEDLLAQTPGLVHESDEPVLFGGWLRAIRLRRTGPV